MPYAPWGEPVDYFGLDAIIGTVAKIVNGVEGKDKSQAIASDQVGTIVAATLYDERASPSNEYRLKAELDLDLLFLGQSAALSPYGYAVVTGIDIATQNGGDLPVITFTGETGASATNRKYNIPTYALTATLSAQLFGAVTLTNCKATAGKLSAKCTMARPLGTSGVNLAHDLSGAVVEVTIDVVATESTAPSAAAVTGWEIIKPLTMSAPNTEYATGSVTVRKHLALYVAP
jgi:hypothetical protein